MLKEIESLKESEKEKLFDAIPMITLLIGGADGILDNREKDWSERVTKVRAYAHQPQLQDYYEAVGERFRSRLSHYINEMPRDADERTQLLSKRLEELTPVLKMLKEDTAVKLLESWRTFAKHVANASGGFMSYLREGPKEADLIDLPMIDYQSNI